MSSKGLFEAVARGFGLILAVNAALLFVAALPVRSEFSTGAFWARFLAMAVIGVALLLRGGVVADRLYRDRHDANV